MKKINEQKLQAFAIGTMGKRPLSKKEQEDRRKREEETAAAHAFKEFVETFQESPSTSKVWVKAGTYDAGSRREDHRDKGKLYKPTSKQQQQLPDASSTSGDKSSADKALEYANSLASSDAKRDAASHAKNKKSQEKKKSNLELFKEELRQIQEERQERFKYKSIAKSIMTHSAPEPEFPLLRETEFGSMDNGDPNTTNIYLGNLNPKITEQQLMELFGRYGPLASIKIMWPRSEEEKNRGRNCGFVAYMSRLDAERALRCLNGRDVMNYEMKLGWGKSVTILNHPIYIPPALVEHVMPPPPSGLPFNAQPQPCDAAQFPPKEYFHNYHSEPDVKRDMEEISYRCIVKVMIPTERPLLALVHRMIEFVVREGPMFEAMIMSREIDNPIFRFLFENESPAHIYYRWKLFSLLQGDTPSEWRQQEFRMFRGGAIWKPPASNFYTQGMPEELIVDEDAPETNKGALSTAQRDRLEDLIRQLTPERTKIADTMIFCIEHADAADEICDCIEESFANVRTQPSRKIARLYLVSDLLHNCTVKVSNASFYRKSLERHLESIFTNLNAAYRALESRLKAEGFKLRVLQVFRAWEEWAVYQREFLVKLKHLFMGIGAKRHDDDKHNASTSASDIDGTALSGDEKEEDEDLDGVPLDGAALLKSAMMRGIPSAGTATASPARIEAPLAAATSASAKAPIHRRGGTLHDLQRSNNDLDSDEYDDDIDGVPVADDDIDGVPLDSGATGTASKAGGGGGGGFMPSKWETVDPDQVEAQAITTSKWDTLDPVAPEPPSLSSATASVAELSTGDDTAQKRQRLREIEVKIVQYQDELESGERALKSGWSIAQQTEHYRRKLMRKDTSAVGSAAAIVEVVDSPQSVGRRAGDYRRTSVSPPAMRKSSSSTAKKSSSSSAATKRSPSPSYSLSSSAGARRRSRSPHTSKRYARDSVSPPAPASARLAKLKRGRSRSASYDDSPVRHRRDRSRSAGSRTGSPPSRRHRSPSPSATAKSSRGASPPPSSSRRSARDQASPPSSRHRSSLPDKHSSRHSSSKYSKY